MRIRILCLLLLALVAAGTLAAPALAAPGAGSVRFQENRPTREQPSPGAHFEEAPLPEGWSYKWVAEPLVVIMILMVVALIIGFLVRWVGVGRRAA